MSPDNNEKQRRSFAYGNVKLHNDDITRDDIDNAADELNENSLVPVYHKDKYSYILISDVPDKYYDEFRRWAGFQTRPVIKDDEDDVDAVFVYDWKRWLAWKTDENDYLIFN